MYGQMMDECLLIQDTLEHAARYHGGAEIVSREIDGSVHRYSYRQAYGRVKKLANALASLDMREGDRVATLAWNDHRHFELYYGISGSGGIVHTVNPRLSEESILYIIGHAENRLLFIDLEFVGLIEKLQNQLPDLEKVIVLCSEANLPDSTIDNILCYEDLINDFDSDYSWQRFDSETAASLCYTSGTTGKPKGVLYSHASTIEHAKAIGGGEGWSLNRFSSVMPVVPMFHASAWGIPYAATMAGCKLVLPGSKLDGASLYELISQEKVDGMCGVPTIWQLLLDYLNQNRLTLATVERTIVGGAAVPLSMIKEFDQKHNVFVMHGWGMTEVSPVGTVNYKTPEMMELSRDEQYQLQLKQGKPLLGLTMRIVNDAGENQPFDGVNRGYLQVKGRWVAKSYYKSNDRSAFTDDGWFDTGDIATIDQYGYMQIVDRAKDLIKSCGEWISSIDIENLVESYDGVREAAVIAADHPKWGERPLLIVTLKKGFEKIDVANYVSQKLTKMNLSDAIIVRSTLPYGATGKVLKQELREEYVSFLLKK